MTAGHTPGKRPVDVTDIKAEYHGNDKFSICCNHDGARFHFWWERGTQPIPIKLYKNPPLSVNRHEHGHYDTRTLRPLQSEAATSIVHAMWRGIGQAELDAAKAKWQAVQDANAAKQRQYADMEALRNRAPELLAQRDALLAALREIATGAESWNDCVRIARRFLCTDCSGTGDMRGLPHKDGAQWNRTDFGCQSCNGTGIPSAAIAAAGGKP